MSTFQKLFFRFLGQEEGSYQPNLNSKNSQLRRSQSSSKVINSRRQRSFEILKSASCLSCGINEQDRQLSINNIDTVIPLRSRYEFNVHKKMSDQHDNSYFDFQQDNVKQKRRAQTKLIILRHGERVDAFFGENWILQAFDNAGNYRRRHNNLPASLPYRQRFHDYIYDPPLSELGIARSFRTGEALYRAGLHIDYCYSSPSLRCIQTADALLDGMKLRTLMPIRIELGLFECGLWHKNVIPHFMSINELVLNRFNIETSYNSVQKTLSTDESEYDYYERSHFVIRQILAKHEQNDLTILFIGHAPSLETLTRQLIGSQPRPHELVQIAQKINYLSLTILEGQRNSWRFVDAILTKPT